MSKRQPVKLSRDGLPVDNHDWTEMDWQDLHEAIETTKRKIARRHKPAPCIPESGELTMKIAFDPGAAIEDAIRVLTPSQPATEEEKQ